LSVCDVAKIYSVAICTTTLILFAKICHHVMYARAMSQSYKN